MRIARLRGPHEFEIIEAKLPHIEPDEVLLRVAACGVCTSELDVWEGTSDWIEYPRFPGHEVSGVIEKTGSAVTGLAPGDRVGAWVLERGFADYVAVKAAYCFSAGDLPLEQVLAEPLACAVNAVELAGISLGDDLVIIGAGFMGNLVQKLAALRGPRQLIVADVRPDALQRARALGATEVVNTAEESLPERVGLLTGGKGADVSFEVTGGQGPLNLIGEVTRMSGKLVIVGFHQGGARQINLAYWNWMAFQILNAHFRDVPTIMRGMELGMRLLTSRRVSMADLISHTFTLDQIDDAFQAACDKPTGFVKSTVLMHE